MIEPPPREHHQDGPVCECDQQVGEQDEQQLHREANFNASRPMNKSALRPALLAELAIRHTAEAHLRRILKTYATYYNEVRTHLSLGKDAPNFRRSESVGSVVAIPILGGLHRQYVRL
jgi:hypothetical protein